MRHYQFSFLVNVYFFICKNMVDVYFWRQILVLSSCIFYSVCMGFMHGFPAVLNPAITSPNSTDIRTSGDHASWIAAINGIGGVFGAFVQSPMMQFVGRRASHYSSNLSLLIGWIMIYFSKNIGTLYAARLVQGIASGGIYINSVILGEYVHPCRRGYFITSKKVAIAFGSLICHAMNAFWTWRQIAIFASFFPLAAIVLTFFWPESPSYLVLKGKFTECEKSFKWLNGNSEESQNQLKSLVEAQRLNIKPTTHTCFKSFHELWMTFLKQDFKKSILISLVLTITIDLCGKYYFGAYIVQIMQNITNSQTSATYFTLGADTFTLIALVLSTVLIKYVNRRTILMSSGGVAVLLMLSISVLVYLSIVYNFTKYYNWFIAIMIILQCFVVNVGLIPVSFAIVGEIFPLQDKGIGSWVSTVVFTTLYAVILKLTPVLMEYTGLYGTYIIYGVSLALCLMHLYKAVPETKDKTLQEIEDELNNIHTRPVIFTETQRLMHLMFETLY